MRGASDDKKGDRRKRRMLSRMVNLRRIRPLDEDGDHPKLNLVARSLSLLVPAQSRRFWQNKQTNYYFVERMEHANM